MLQMMQVKHHPDGPCEHREYCSSWLMKGTAWTSNGIPHMSTWSVPSVNAPKRMDGGGASIVLTTGKLSGLAS